MSIRRTDTEEARKFWEFVDRTSKYVREEFPSWTRDARSSPEPEENDAARGCTTQIGDDDED